MEKEKGLVEAVDSGNEMEILVALRKQLARDYINTGNARDKAAVSKSIIATTKMIGEMGKTKKKANPKLEDMRRKKRGLD